MDWAIQAARKKNKRIPGGSRSIVETLNVFNDVITEGDLEINKILNRTGTWASEISNVLQEQLSPEKTLKVGSMRTIDVTNEEKTPERIVQLPSTTPRSLTEETVLVPRPQSASEEESGPGPLPAPPQRQEGFIKGRRATTRRSNVFVPLPSKDPLVVQPAHSHVPATVTEPPTIPSATAAMPGSAAPSISAQGSNALFSPAPAASPIAPLAGADTGFHRIKRPISTASTTTRANVFDRLSSIPTKSFENKVNRTARKGSSASSIDVTGSPIRRSSPRRNPGTVVDSSIQEALKNIFSTQRQRTGSYGAGKVAKKDSPISHFSRSINCKTNLKSPTRGSPIHVPPSPKHASQQKPNSSQPTRQKYDRLTKFQLLPPVESEKDDLKKKLNKRLSEVVRTQQEQNRRRQEQQKRKSHLEEDLKRRTKLWNDTLTAINTNKTPISNNAPQQPEKSNTILHDLYLTDHRTVLGENDSAGINATTTGCGENGNNNYTVNANQSLPYIHSDSEEEEDGREVALAPWARSPYLQKQLQLQQNWDPKKIFGPIPPLHIDEIFQHSRLSRLKPKKG